jgi:hypothetical protein
MRPKPIKISLLAVAMAALLSWPAGARAGTIYSRPYDGVSPCVPSEVFTDTSPNYTTYSTKAFDDVTVTGNGWLVQGATIYGQEQGASSQNLSINLQFQSSALPDFNNTAGIITGETEDPNGNLNFTGLNVFLAPGTYWISAWVVRPELPIGGQWFWYTTDAGSPIGSEVYIQNPGGSLIPGASIAVPGSTVLGTLPSDLAFTLYGSVVPEPSSVVLLAIGGLGLSILARRSHVTALEGTGNQYVARS